MKDDSNFLRLFYCSLLEDAARHAVPQTLILRLWTSLGRGGYYITKVIRSEKIRDLQQLSQQRTVAGIVNSSGKYGQVLCITRKFSARHVSLVEVLSAVFRL